MVICPIHIDIAVILSLGFRPQYIGRGVQGLGRKFTITYTTASRWHSNEICRSRATVGDWGGWSQIGQPMTVPLRSPLEMITDPGGGSKRIVYGNIGVGVGRREIESGRGIWLVDYAAGE